MTRILSIFGTRPEAIKMAPVVQELARHRDAVESLICVTAQHREMLDQVLDLFHITPDIDLALMEENQKPAAFTGTALNAVTGVLRDVRPDMVLVQGDTTTAMAAGLAAFYERIPAGHVEAGLRTHNPHSPFPEEMNRRLLGALSALHFAPTESAATALRGEGIADDTIFVTGNTVVDALLWVQRQPLSEDTTRLLATLRLDDLSPPDGHRTVLVTCHRRENHGAPLVRICRALKSLVQRNPGVQVVYPVHLNPVVRRTVFDELNGHQGIHLIDPLPYDGLVALMSRSYLVLTDSGGLQEEAPAMGKPVLVLRDDTERPESVSLGHARVVGTSEDSILVEAERLLQNPETYREMAQRRDVFGDGKAAERIVGILRSRALPRREVCQP